MILKIVRDIKCNPTCARLETLKNIQEKSYNRKTTSFFSNYYYEQCKIEPSTSHRTG